MDFLNLLKGKNADAVKALLSDERSRVAISKALSQKEALTALEEAGAGNPEKAKVLLEKLISTPEGKILIAQLISTLGGK